MGNLIKPVGKPQRGQSSQNIILELALASPSNYILQILPSLWLLFGCLFRWASLTKVLLKIILIPKKLYKLSQKYPL